MHPLIGVAILAAAAVFVAFAFRQGMGVRRERRTDDGTAVNLGADSGSHHHAGDSGFGHG